MNVIKPIKTSATYQDVLDAPPNMVAELIEGELYLNPRPTPRHSHAALRLASVLDGPFMKGEDGPGGWWIVLEPEVHFEDDAHAVVPDVGGWLKDDVPRFPDTAYFESPPSWVCEVLSPSTRKLDLTTKRDFYARQGVREIWFVDPLARTLEAFSHTDGAWTLISAFKDDESVSLPPFDAIAFSLAVLWPD